MMPWINKKKIAIYLILGLGSPLWPTLKAQHTLPDTSGFFYCLVDEQVYLPPPKFGSDYGYTSHNVFILSMNYTENDVARLLRKHHKIINKYLTSEKYSDKEFLKDLKILGFYTYVGGVFQRPLFGLNIINLCNRSELVAEYKVQYKPRKSIKKYKVVKVFFKLL